MTEDEVVGWHHRLNGHEFDQALGVGEGQESLDSFMGLLLTYILFSYCVLEVIVTLLC